MVTTGADINTSLNIVNDTALHIAARYNRPALIEPMIQHGVDVPRRNSTGNTALDIAIQRGRWNFVERFIFAVRDRKFKFDENFRYTALTAAAENYQVKSLRLLLDAFPETVNLNLDEEAGRCSQL